MMGIEVIIRSLEFEVPDYRLFSFFWHYRSYTVDCGPASVAKLDALADLQSFGRLHARFRRKGMLGRHLNSLCSGLDHQHGHFLRSARHAANVVGFLPDGTPDEII